MKFRTELNPEPFSFKLTHKDPVCFLGSCFSENISSRFSDLGYSVLANPHGVLYGAQALLENLRRAVSNEAPMGNELLDNGSSWVFLFGHSTLNGRSRDEVKQNIQQADTQLREELKKAKVCFVSLGSAWVYRHIGTGLVVGNCHKIPQQQFQKFLQEPAEVKTYLDRMLSLFSRINPNLQVVFTVSPVKHIRDGIVENALSKAVLLTAIHQVVRSNKQSFYFPAYELITEDLRDYRFYAEDMAHPNDQGVEYIWKKLAQVLFDEDQQQLNQRIAKLRKSMGHRPLDPDSEESKAFQLKLQSQLEELYATTGVRL